MNREILFKAKCTDGNNWIYGDLIHRIEGTSIGVVDSDGLHEMYVDKNTVCEYTGLCDKHGKKIFEGDILKEDRYDLIREVIWEMSCGSCCTQVIGFGASGSGHTDFISLSDLDRVEIIGNKFDNPELLN